MSKSKWTEYQPSEQDLKVARLAHFGTKVSKQLSGGSARVSKRTFDYLVLKPLGIGWQYAAAVLEHFGLLVYEQVADLDQVGLRIEGQRTWNVQRWEREIRKRTGERTPHCALCGKNYLTIAGHRCRTFRVKVAKV